jgi:phosphate transport system substrate-binding protein
VDTKKLLIQLGWTWLFGLMFFIVYLGFSLLWGIGISAIGEETLLFRSHRLGDAGVALAGVLYCMMVAVLFVVYGAVLSRYVSERRLRLYGPLLGTLTVPVLGLVIWFLLAGTISGRQTYMDEMSWLPFMLYAFWTLPIVETWKVYLSGPVSVNRLAALLSLLPVTAVFLGFGLYRLRLSKEGLRRGAWMCGGAFALLLVSILLSALPIRETVFSWNSYPAVDGATAAIPLGKELLQELTGTSKAKADKTVRFNTSHEAYVNLIEKRADLILVSGPSDEELKLAEEKQVKLKLTPVGKDAFIFLVHKANPVQGLSLKQVQDIYTGSLTSWQQAGGENQPILAFQRPKNSGSQTFMENKVMKGLPLTQAPTERKPTGMGGLIDEVADYKNSKQAIGYTFYYFANEMHRREEVKFLALDGIEPNKEHIRSNRYPLTAQLYAVTREGEPENEGAARLLGYLLSPEGKQVIERGGFVPSE